MRTSCVRDKFVGAWLISNDCLIIRPSFPFLVGRLVSLLMNAAWGRMEGSEQWRCDRTESELQTQGCVDTLSIIVFTFSQLFCLEKTVLLNESASRNLILK